MEHSFSEYSLSAFATALSSKAPVPGGGGASALIGAVGAALTGMVCSLTLGKQKYADVQADVARIQARAEALRLTLLSLIERDAEAFAPLAEAYGLPAVTDAEKAEKAAVMERALRLACSVPMEIMERCCEAAALAEEVARIGSAIALSDAGCAAACCRAALTGSALNVFINTKSMADRDAAAELNARADAMLEQYVPLCDRVYQAVAARFAQ